VREEDRQYAADIGEAYERVVYFRKNLFALPSGQSGRMFVREKTRFFNILRAAGPLEQVAMKAAMVMEALLLQRTSAKAKARDHREALGKRLALWSEGRIAELLEEAAAIQGRLPTQQREMDESEVSRIFAKLVFEGKLRAGLDFLQRATQGGAQKLSPEVVATLKSLHPRADPGPPEVYKEGTPPEVHPV
jgi:hypothetical protein